jgi:drug/metabolite transporter (DMT)-like permease
MIITFYILKKEEVSRVISITYTYPIFVAIIAVPFLGESLSYLQWLAIIVVVGGAVIISAERGPSGTSASLSKSFLPLLATSLLFAVSDICSKYALNHISIWNAYGLAVISLAIIFLAVSIRPDTINKLMAMKQKGTAFGLIISNQTTAMIGAMLQLLAISMGPISLVSTVVSTRPVFVAVFSIIMGLIIPNFLIAYPSGKAMIVRCGAIILIVGGISIIYLT